METTEYWSYVFKFPFACHKPCYWILHALESSKLSLRDSQKQTIITIYCFHTTAKCVFWIWIRIAHFELRSVHMIEVLAYFELRIIHTSDRKCDSPFESVEKRHGCVWVACQSNMHVCCLRFLCMCSARYYRWKWLEGHTSSAPQNTILRSSHSYTDFVACGKHLCTVIWDAHFKLRFATWFGIHTVFFAYFEF